MDDELGETKARDGAIATIGGLITEKTIKTTKKGQLMAFLTVEDVVGTVEVVVFPNSFTANRVVIDHAEKVFVTGKVQANVDENAKLICDKVVDFANGQGLGNLNGLNDIQRKVYDIIARRFLSIFFPAAEYEKVSLEIGRAHV